MALAASFIAGPTSVREPVKEKHESKIKNFDPNHRYSVFNTRQENPLVCIFSMFGYSIYTCDEFRNVENSDRHSWVQKSRLCFFCLKMGHQAKDCRNKRSCGFKGCIKYHHRLLHDDERSECKFSARSDGHTTSTGVRNGCKSGHVVAHF